MGMAFALVAYFGYAQEKISKWSWNFGNLLAGVTLLAVAIHDGTWGFIGLNIVWSAIALKGIFAPKVQMEERPATNREDGGSNPLRGTYWPYICGNPNCVICGSTPKVQLDEYPTPNRVVPGSIPGGGME